MRRRQGNVKAESEIGMMQPQTKECLNLPGAGRDMKNILSKSLQRSVVLLSL